MSSSDSLTLNFLLTPVHLSHKTQDDARSAPLTKQVYTYDTADLLSVEGLALSHPLPALFSTMGFYLPDEISSPWWEHGGVDCRKQMAELARRR